MHGLCLLPHCGCHAPNAPSAEGAPRHPRDGSNFISLSALLYSGDAYLQRQARDVLMRSGAFLRVSDDDLNGELPHHFVDDKPTYTALSVRPSATDPTAPSRCQSPTQHRC